MPGSLGIEGAAQLRALGPELRAAPKAMRSRLRRNIVAEASVITSEAKSGYQDTYGGLGAALASATGTSVITSGPRTGVAVRVRGARLPAGKQGLPPLVEGLQRWRHPLFGDTEHWYDQDPHPELALAVHRHLPGVRRGVISAVDETALALAHG
jgi:hypothetical protein